MNRLTPQQRQFAQSVADGSSYTAAYRAAYRCHTAKPHTVSVDASRLANMPKIAAAIEQMYRQATWNEADWRQEAIFRLLDEAKNGDTTRDRLRALKMLGRIMRRRQHSL